MISRPNTRANSARTVNELEEDQFQLKVLPI